ncbi:sugar transferase [Desulfococcaceae bacterium HSG9]|nr:sugar transferase [Desulfococcaceae bacterium HSG9]
MKRLFDLFFTLIALIVLSPIMLSLVILIRLCFGNPVFFRQIRPGLNGKPFTIYKFRTMLNAYDKNGHLLPDSERLTEFGKLLRQVSLDELPELFNVLKGEMSLVGPRPLLMQYLTRYTPYQMRRHEIRPGITGWAQIHGRNNTPFSKRFEMDIWYVDNHSLSLDFRIIIYTASKVIKREGVRTDLDQCFAEVNDCGL